MVIAKNKTRINATLPDSLLEAIDGAVEAKRDKIAELTGKRSDSAYSRSDLIQTAVEDYLDNTTTKGDTNMITLATRSNDDTINNTYLFDSMKEAIKPYIGIEQDSAAVPVMLMPHRISETELVWDTEVGGSKFHVTTNDYTATLEVENTVTHDVEMLLVAAPSPDSMDFEDEFASAAIRAIAKWW